MQIAALFCKTNNAYGITNVSYFVKDNEPSFTIPIVFNQTHPHWYNDRYIKLYFLADMTSDQFSVRWQKAPCV